MLYCKSCNWSTAEDPEAVYMTKLNDIPQGLKDKIYPSFLRLFLHMQNGSLGMCGKLKWWILASVDQM